MAEPQRKPTLVAESGDQVQQALYAKRQKIYPREVHGIFAGLRVLCAGALLGLYYGLPWLRWDGHQAVLLDLPARKFHLFGLTLWPQDFIYLAMLLIIAGLSLFLFTALAGRLWCGYACPQTVWTEVFLALEHCFEGDRSQQLRLDKSPLSTRKFFIKAGKHTTWVLFAAFTGFTFVAYFTPMEQLARDLVSLQCGPWESFWIGFYSLATYGNAGWLREQVCLYMCPYARFQSAMFDDDTFIIAYDDRRGEPRGSRKRGTEPQALGLGDCIDCQMCVQVCPTGIDIRRGLQYQCIGCASCIDACDDVMDKMGYPKGLVRYVTQNSLTGKAPRLLRPRILIYALSLSTLAGALLYSLWQRVPLQLDVIRDRTQLFRETRDGRIENVYTLKIINMDEHAHRYRLAAHGIRDLQLDTDTNPVSVEGGAVADVPVRLRVPEAALAARSSEVVFMVNAEDDARLSAQEPGRFLGPAPAR